MNRIEPGVFGKVFLYTLLFLLLTVGITAGIFARQFVAVYEIGRRQQAAESLRPFVSALQGKSQEEMIELAQSFSQGNPAFQFHLQTGDGRTLFRTSSRENGVQNSQLVMAVDQDTTLNARLVLGDQGIYEELLYRTAATLAILLLVGTIGAALFAQRMTNPIKKLAADTRRMANLEPVPPPVNRRDEVGQLARDVHEMYEKLKQTISNLEREIAREREMEENQRYFFSAASHELKTPIASASALLEGMLENIGDYRDHPKYLRECLRMMGAQNKLISEILEIVRLSDGAITPNPQRIRVQTAVQSAVKNLHILAGEKDQTIQTNIPDTLYCHCDPRQFERVLLNVVTNAIQNTPEREQIVIWGEERPPAAVRLCVLNTNTRIDEEHLSRLFEPFYRLDRARTSSQGHSGLGLTIVKKTLDRMGVAFSMENTDRGVLFWMDLPASES